MTNTCNDCTHVPPCSSSAGCISTNYAKCIYFSGTSLSDCVTIANGDNLDTVISALATAICNVTPTDLNWAGFDYGCYAADAWSTAQEFAEGLTAKVCSIDAGSGLLPAGTTIPVAAPTNISGLTPGTSTIEESYEAIFADLTAFDLFNTDGSVTQGCFTAVPAGDNLKQWIQWVRTNVCSIRTEILNITSELDTRTGVIEDFIGDINTIDNTDCSGLWGGTSTDTLMETIGYIKTAVCGINTITSALPDFSAITMAWNTCVGLYPSYGNTASLNTQLGRILTQLSLRTYSFSGDFTVTTGACGTSIALASPGTSFACADLGSCALKNVGDVYSYTLGGGSGDKFKVLSWDITNQEWFPKTVTMSSSGGTVDVSTKTDSGSVLTYNFEVNITDGGVSDDTSLVDPIDIVIGSASGGSRSIGLKYNSNFFSSPVAVTFTGAPGVTTASGYVSDSAAWSKRAGVVYMGGAYDVAVTAFSAGSYFTLGNISASGIPTGSNRSFSTIATDVATDTAYNVILQVDTSGNIQMKNATGALLATATYCITFSGFSYVQ